MPVKRGPLVELCAGSAAVGVRWLRAGARPPLAYQGGKRGYADAILDEVGEWPGAGSHSDLILVEPGPWGEAWDLWRTPQGRAGTVDRLRAWQGEDPRTLWDRLRKAPVPEGVEDRVAVWAVLQWWSFARMPVAQQGGAWRASGFNTAEAYAASIHAKQVADGKTHGNGLQARYIDQRLPIVVDQIARLPDLSRVRVLRCRAEEVPPIPGALVYIDPPYRGTTCAYGHDLPGVEALALRWAEEGCRVAVSEAQPLGLPGWRTVKLSAAAGFGRTWSRQKDEWLTISPEADDDEVLEALTPRR